MSPLVSDITIAGAGPAGLALASRLIAQGARVVVVDPTPERPWPNRYGAWAHEVDRAGLSEFVDVRWSRPLVYTAPEATAVDGAYCRIDKSRLQAHGLRALTEVVSDQVIGVATDARGATVHTRGGLAIRSARVVDATGSGVLLPARPAPRAYQTAHGVLARVSGHPWGPGEASVMDFRPLGTSGPCTFLYALPVSSDTVFVEETSLAATPEVGLVELEQRLSRRLAQMGIEVLETDEVERCRIPMDTPIPKRGPVVPFGASAGWIHPATGYQLTRAWRSADAVATALVRHLDADAETASKAAWAAVWPTAQLRTRALHDLGLEVLLGFTPDQVRAFFAAFFRLPPKAWRAYLDALSPPAAVADAMARVFLQLENPLRASVLGHALGRGRVHLARTLQVGGAT